MKTKIENLQEQIIKYHKLLEQLGDELIKLEKQLDDDLDTDADLTFAKSYLFLGIDRLEDSWCELNAARKKL